MKKIKYKNQQELTRIKNEIKMLESFHNDNIVQYIESFLDDDDEDDDEMAPLCI